MRTRSPVPYLLLVVLPLAALGWLGVRTARQEVEANRHRWRALLAGRLADFEADVAGMVASRERQLTSGPALSRMPVDELRALSRTSPLVQQYFVLDDDDRLAYPAPEGATTEAEREFLERTRHVWLEGAIPVPVEASRPAPTGKGGKAPDVRQRAGGWYAWVWGDRLRLIRWWREDTGRIAGAELNAGRLIADVIGVLPSTEGAEAFRVALVGASGAVLYQWGAYEPGEEEASRASLAMDAPLGLWRLEYYAPEEFTAAGAARAVYFNLFAGLAAVGATLAVLAAHLYRRHARDLREAAQRVSFVNQVSHELKTPLTNIRMYAEMLEADLDEDDANVRRRLDIIVAESQRLSRLIGNVLTFSRKQRSALTLRPAPGDVDETLRTVIRQFEEPLRRKGIAVAFDPGVGEAVWFDPDAVGQIVGNLLSNVEKYAATASRVEVVSHRDGETIRITVADNGPGIPVRERGRVFEPFHRVSNELTDGVAGTGIGLSIARDLARLHGGDVVLKDATGACFEVTLDAPRPDAGEEGVQPVGNSGDRRQETE